MLQRCFSTRVKMSDSSVYSAGDHMRSAAPIARGHMRE